ncbi:uncharacterized protein BDZ99DRAFT_154590 [Mytilinidion resinicola]|uniref:Uncharacterized protein n=1 Tax=Mytilinidion resinicola TaxID=574789 RepID=A0A6A6Y903_9PEZI|nr:uncharacterized protein BDZ99DRAFT_154590 [Mytilinidion resinicola]KAF2804297.1 hypothetical protein BDZ99DRAFT_154590 [Mytilinidion resinicola]
MSSNVSVMPDIQRYDDHYEANRAPSPVPKKVDSWDVKYAGGGCEDLTARGLDEYPASLEECDDYSCGSAPITHDDPPLSPPSSNTGTPSRPVAQQMGQMTLTPDDTPESQRVRPWQPFTPEAIRNRQMFYPNCGRSERHSLSSKSDTSGRSYYPAREQLSPSPQPGFHRQYRSDASEISDHTGAGANNHHSDSGDVYYTPSQSPSHSPYQASVQSRNLTHDEGKDKPGFHLSAPRIPQKPFPFSVYDPYDQQYVPKAINKYDQEWTTRE